MKFLRSLALIGLVGGTALGIAPPVVPQAAANEAGDLVFAERGPWDLSKGDLIWHLSQQGPEVEGFAPLGEGTITMTGAVDPADGKQVLQLAEDTARIKRKIGPFPITGGDPTLTFFLESTARDMATLTGGSPFYIRNRLKDALFRGGAVEQDGAQTVAVFEPFKNDKNIERMFGFETLVLRFTLDSAGQPIRRMSARTGELAGGRPAYVNEMVLQ